MMSALGDAAAFLAQQWPCFPCGSDKRPITEHGFKDASRDGERVKAMFDRPGAQMIGVPTGEISDMVAIDLDVKNGGAGLEWQAANAHRLPRTRQHGTRSGGRHLLFLYPVGRNIRNSASKIAPGVDVRGNGGFVIFPPSDGYSITDDAMPVQMPAWLVELLDPPQPVREPVTYQPPRAYDGEGTPYGRRALERECEAICNAAEGTKHSVLNKAAYSIGGLVTAGELQEGAAWSELSHALSSIRDRCEDFKHAERTLREAFTQGKAKPRSVPVSDYQPDEAPEAGISFGTREVLVQIVEAPTPKPSPLWVDSSAWDASAIPKRPWAVPSYLMRGSVSVLTGQGAGGKSSLVVAWTIACATGEAIGNFAPRAPMACVNYNVEDDREEQQRRYSAALAARELNGAEVMPRIVRCGPHDVGTLFERDPSTGRITETTAMQALERICMETEAELLVCDPLAELHNAEENDNTAMRSVVAAFRSLARRLDISVLLLHHNRKGGSTPGDMDQMRGASAISGAVRVVLTLAPMTEEEADKLGVPSDQRKRHFRIDGAKSNYAIAGEAEWWKLSGHEIGNGETVAACMPWEPPSVFAEMPMDLCVQALTRLQRGKDGLAWASSKQAGADWAGHVLTAEPLNRTDGQAKSILNAWVESGVLVESNEPGPRRGHTRKAYVVDAQALSDMQRQVPRAGQHE